MLPKCLTQVNAQNIIQLTIPLGSPEIIRHDLTKLMINESTDINVQNI